MVTLLSSFGRVKKGIKHISFSFTHEKLYALNRHHTGPELFADQKKIIPAVKVIISITGPAIIVKTYWYTTGFPLTHTHLVIYDILIASHFSVTISSWAHLSRPACHANLTFRAMPAVDEGVIASVSSRPSVHFRPMGLVISHSHHAEEGEDVPSLPACQEQASSLPTLLLRHNLEATLCLGWGASRYDVRIRGEGSWKSGRSKGGCVNFIVYIISDADKGKRGPKSQKSLRTSYLEAPLCNSSIV